MIGLPGDLVAALLPEAVRRAFCARTGADPLRGSYALGLVQVFVGGPWWVWLAVEYIRDVAQASASAVLGQESGAIHTLRFALVALGPLAYLISLRGLLLGYVVVTGMVRLISALVQSQPLGDPLLALALWASKALRNRWRARSLLARLGPERPDRVESRPGGLRVVACRAKPEWTPRATIQVGDTFYRVIDAALGPDGRFLAFAYALTPLGPGALIRQPLVYREAAENGGQAETRVTQEPKRPPAPPTGSGLDAEERVPARRWRVDAGEEARLHPDGRGTVVSRGLLPLRPRSVGEAGRRDLLDLPGTALRVGTEWLEVVTEQAGTEDVRYGLEPWPPEQVMRDTLHYGPALVRGAQRERRIAARRARWQRRAWPAYPLVGMLPETAQCLVCDRLGLVPEVATCSGALLELTALTWWLAHGVQGPPGDPTGGSLYAMLGGAVVLGPLAGLALLRGLGAAALGTVAGSPLLAPIAWLRWLGRPRVERYDDSVLPLTRAAFWRRLARADHQRPEPDGSLLVESLLPHLSWTRPPWLLWQGQRWSVELLPPRDRNGRLSYRYRLHPSFTPEQDASPPVPPADLYQREVLASVASDWSDLLESGLAPLVSMSPHAVQRRAMEGRGGARSIRSAALGSSLAQLALGAWCATDGEVALLLVGAALAADALQRLLHLASGGFAPSLFGGLFADALPPERRSYRAHLAAEREALAASRAGAEHP